MRQRTRTTEEACQELTPLISTMGNLTDYYSNTRTVNRNHTCGSNTSTTRIVNNHLLQNQCNQQLNITMNKINEMKMTFGFSSLHDTLYVKMGNTYLHI